MSNTSSTKKAENIPQTPGIGNIQLDKKENKTTIRLRPKKNKENPAPTK